MPETPPTFYLTTPIYYVNARPHIGHAYTTIVADVLARRSRAQGTDTWFLTGTDEHGQKIERSAQAAGIPPQQFADEVSQSFRDLWQRMGITNDQFIRTTSEAHKRGVQKLFADLHAKGKIYLSSYTGQYSIGEEMFVEGPPGTIGPDGKPTETVTEENFFFRLSDYQLPLLDLIESDTLKITPEARKNEVLSFLRGPVGARPGAPSSTDGSIVGQGGVSDEVRPSSLDPIEPVGPNDLGTAPHTEPEPTESAPSSGLAFSKSGNSYVPGALRDLSVSRSSFTWGIPVPEPAASEAKEKHVIYVWLDALANYITALGYGSDDETNFQKFWPADLHLVGKEIIRFHCVYWPAFLLAAGLDIPKAVTAHGWLLFDDSKMSKSKGNIVRTETILDAFGTLCPLPSSSSPSDVVLKGTPSGVPPQTPTSDPALAAEVPSSSPSAQSQKGGSSGLQPAESNASEEGASAPAIPTPHQRDLFAADVLRYFLLREIPFGQDGSFTFDALITRYNADLANGYGNLVSRTLSMIGRYNDSIITNDKPVEAERPAGHPADVFFSSIVGPGKMAYANEQDKSFFRFRHSVGPIDKAIENAFRNNDFTTITETLSWAVSITDSYLTSCTPWKMPAGIDRDAVLYAAAESIRIITLLLHPILPYSTASVWNQLGLSDISLATENHELRIQWGGLKPGTKLGPLAPIFPRADKGLAQIMADMESSKNEQKNLTSVTDNADAATPTATEFKEAPIASLTGQRFEAPAEQHHAPTDPAAGPRTSTLAEPNPGAQVAGSAAHTTERTGTPPHTEAASGIFASQPADSSPQITIDDFAKVELRVAKILVCERIPKADKLLRLEVDLGYEQRQILSGIAEWYTPEELLGRRIVVITNLAPRKMRGLESHGMLLAASAEPSAEGEKPGKPHLATFAGADSEALPLGSRLK